ncbi:Integrase, catalytic core [Cucumis melo var. makuwa]|uniref:Integrase, catalytic core n=1 Tax=Cucumis melo var. makuwa TaxID=1194695 RepID=A0A5D3BCX4_CUCMM|nr:Integrase, catalytic core [Cucumis melo var. makuwa]TYJ96816.1 Integrase, catalytic core [Cucumis melo var. makuwa]
MAPVMQGCGELWEDLDLGAMHSFVSSIFLTKMNMILQPLSKGLVICTPVGDVFLVNEVLRNCEVFNRRSQYVSGSSFTRVTDVGCFTEVVFRGERKIAPSSLISALKAEKLLRKGCIVILAHIVDALPPNREVKFNIELLQEFIGAKEETSQSTYPNTPFNREGVCDLLGRFEARIRLCAYIRSELRGIRVVVTTESSGSLLAQFQVQSFLVAEIMRRQQEDSDLQKMLEKTKKGLDLEFELRVKQDVQNSKEDSLVACEHDGIWVIVDKLTKTARFIRVKAMSTLDHQAKFYIDRIVSQYGVPVSIVSNRDMRSTSKFWPSLQKA